MFASRKLHSRTVECLLSKEAEPEPQLISATRSSVRCRCLYEIGFTPQDKLTLLTHGFDKAAIADAFDVINVAEDQAWLVHCLHSSPALRALANPKP